MRKTVFIQDKLRDNLEIYEMILAKQGLHVVCTTSEIIRSETLKKNDPDVILLNYEYLHKLHKRKTSSEVERYSSRLQKPILLAVDEQDLESIKFEDLSNISELIIKPFIPATLVEKINKIFEGPTNVSKENLEHLIAKTTRKESLEKAKTGKKIAKEAKSKAKPEGVKKAKKRSAKKNLTTKKELAKKEPSPKQIRPPVPRAEEITEIKDAQTLKSWFVQNISKIIEQNWTALSRSKKAERHELLSASIEQLWDLIPLKKIDLASHRQKSDAGALPFVNGDIEVFPTCDVISLISNQALTGMLKLQNKNVTILLFFKDGDLIFGIGKNLQDELKLGRFLVEEKSLTRPTLEELLKEKSKNPNIPFGYFLLTEGYLKDKKILQRAISSQTISIVYEILTWKTGQFNFSLRKELPAMATSVGLAIKVRELIEDGRRRTDEWEFLKAEIGSPASVYQRRPNTENLIPLNMSEIENRIYKEINGINKVRDIVDKVFGHSIDVYRTLHRFNRAGLIERK